MKTAYKNKRDYYKAESNRGKEKSKILEARLRALQKVKNDAYKERDLLVCALSKIFPAHLQRHDEKDLAWENDWRNIVCIHIPVKELTNKYVQGGFFWIRDRQVTWHIHDSELDDFSHLKQELNHWDGHTTEEKYQRLENLDLSKKWYQFWK